MRSLRVSPKLLLTAALAVSALGFAACGEDEDTTTTTTAPAEEGSAAQPPADAGPGNAPAPSGDAVRSAKVEIVDFAYDPDPVTIEEGGKVIWINRDAEPHTATADDGSFDTGRLGEGKLKSESFKKAGEYAYFCELHPSMRGTVEVVESG